MPMIPTSLDDRLGFIVGHYKSGSTWLSHLLALSPDIISVRECHVFRYARTADSFEAANERLFNQSAWGMGGVRRYPRHWAGDATRGIRRALGLARYVAALPTRNVPTSMHDLGLVRHLRLRSRMARAVDADDYCRLLFAELVDRFDPANRLVEKTPTNIFELDAIGRVFPAAKLVSVHRDGRDVVVSDMHHLKRAYNAQESFESRVNKWVRAMNAERDAARHQDIHTLSYEALQAAPDRTLAAVLDHLDTAHDEALRERMIRGASFEASSGGRAAGVEDASRFQRKGIVGDWRNVFTDEQTRTFSELAGPLLVELGYESSDDWREWT